MHAGEGSCLPPHSSPLSAQQHRLTRIMVPLTAAPATAEVTTGRVCTSSGKHNSLLISGVRAEKHRRRRRRQACTGTPYACPSLGRPALLPWSLVFPQVLTPGTAARPTRGVGPAATAARRLRHRLATVLARDMARRLMRRDGRMAVHPAMGCGALSQGCRHFPGQRACSAPSRRHGCHFTLSCPADMPPTCLRLLGLATAASRGAGAAQGRSLATQAGKRVSIDQGGTVPEERPLARLPGGLVSCCMPKLGPDWLRRAPRPPVSRH